ncbi:type I polyketide synthase [Pseudomonas aeruginosa]|uniref:type I polyketide synthase n=1 Tax=Pseudomonas aeruginosa TaxID=287 RepID=UPI00178095CD|nr:type I polyketide synthase [Pseudomonas aeruginosa]
MVQTAARRIIALSRRYFSRAASSIETELLRPAGESRLHLTEIAQPAIFAIQVALTECLRRWGVTPGAVVGHSMGEVAAAWCAGALDLRSAVQVIYHRANAMKGTLGGGRMMVVGASAEELQPMLGPSLEISVVNSHVSCVVSGEAGAVAALEQRLGEAGRFTFLMPAPYAFHSWQMEPCLADIQASLADIEPDAAKIPWISSSAANLQGECADAAYWVRNARGVVRFDRAIERLLEDGARLFVELGPHAVLAQSIQQLAVRAGKAARVFSALQREGDGSTELAAILAGLYENGVAPDWKAYQGDAGFVELPTYPWQREAYWFQATQGVPARAQALHARVQVFDAEGRLCATAEDVALCTVDEPAAALANVPAKKAGARPAVTLAQAREVVSAALSEILGVPCDELDAERGFFELGLTSISLIEFKRKLEARVGLELPATVGFDYPNLEALARRLEQLGAAKEIQPTTCAPAARGADTGHEVAVLGMACRLPRADSPEALWEVLLEQATCVVPVPSSRLTEPVGTRRHASLVERVEGFDEDFFRISPREAGSMDPQQRLFLMVAWEALERAGIPPHDLRERQVGVFVGANAHDYEARLLACAAGIDANYGTGSAFSAISGRLSHFLGLRGPSLTVDTACSSSLTAVHLACNSLLAGECEIAIVGGVNVIASSAIFQSMGDAGALSADGTCKTFDDRADGYGRGEGCGVVILKRAERARADGDRVIAVLLGSAVNHDGACAGLTVPNGPAQEALIREALANASLSAAAVGYVEAHGTGTVLGDPIELQALANAYRGTERVPLAVASVKGNVGHLEAAAGIASLIKACLVVERGVIPGQAGFQRPNSRFDWQATSLQVPQANQPWEVPAAERIAGISAFGFTGTNVHVLLRGEVRDPSERSDGDGSRPWPLCLSAHTDEALRDMAASYERFLAAGEASAAAVCRSAALGRSPLKARLLVFGRGSAELAVALADWRRGIDASMPAELDEGTRSACTAFLNGQPADWLAVFGDVRAWVDLPTYPWQLRDYWLEYGVREPALEDDHPCLLLHSRGMGGEWQWLGRLPEEKSGDETHWHPSGALLLDALLQALAVAEPERAFALVELRLSVPRFSRCGPLASRLTLSLSDKASITLALRGEHDHEWRDVLSAVPLECASPDVDQLELSPADLGQAEAGLVAAALEGQRDGRYGNYRFPLRSDAARRRLLLAETLALFEGAHAAPVVGFARVQVLDDLPEHIAVRVSGAELGRLQSLYAVDEDGCVVALFEGPLLLADEPEQLALADEPAASFLVARWEDFPDEPVVRKSGEWRLLLPGGAGMSRLVSAFSARGLGVREMPWEDVPDSSEWLAEAALDTTCEGLLVPCCGDCDEQRFADFLLALGRAVATCPTGKPIWFLHPPAERADATAARRLGILYGATRALALEQPAWWGGVVELDPADGRGLHRFARLLVGVPRHDHLKIRGTRVFARYLEVRPAASRRIGSASAGGGTVLLHVRAGTDLTPYLLLSPVRRARRLVVLCEQPPRLPVEWAGAPLPETLIVDCADRRALAEVLGRLQAEQSITGFIQARPEWTAGRLEEPTSATRVAAARREMHALENFHGLLAGQPLAFFLILGSLSSLLGGAGFAHQAMVDGFALWLHGERRRAGLPCQLLLGLQTEAELDGLHEVRQRLLGSGLQPLKEERFVRALETLLEEPDGCVGLADGVDWAQLKPLYQNELPWPLLDRLGQPSATVPERAAGFARMPEHLRRRALAALVAEQVAAVFGYPDADAIERSKGFTEMGMSSVMSLDFRSRLGRALGLQLPATFAFEYCSIDAVTDYLALHLQAGPAPVSTEPPARPAQEPGERREISALSRSELIDALEEELRDIENY